MGRKISLNLIKTSLHKDNFLIDLKGSTLNSTPHPQTRSMTRIVGEEKYFIRVRAIRTNMINRGKASRPISSGWAEWRLATLSIVASDRQYRCWSCL